MKVVAFNGSPRRNGNTAGLIQQVLAKLNQFGIETEVLSLAGQTLRGCTACSGCRKNKDLKCVITDDLLNEYLMKMVEADGIIIGSPTYFGNVSAEVKALIDRAGYVSRSNDQLFRRKVGAAVVVARRAGALNVFNAINDFFLINEMIVPGSSYWNIGVGREVGDVENDPEGLRTMEVLGEHMAWLLQKIASK